MRGSGRELIGKNENKLIMRKVHGTKVPNMKVGEMVFDIKAEGKVHSMRAEEKAGKRHHIT